jgi:hypothetical protein
MNERIQELEAQCWEPKQYGPPWFNSKKFAELIVRECIRVPYDMWDKAELNADVAVKIEHRIKEHFGVEE